jgi:hypothetical protein
MAYTGGPLNELNGKMGISAPQNSVSVSKLIKTHSPKTRTELVELIRYHYENKCSCGIVSKGTVETFGKNLFNSQVKYWGEERFTLQECIQWEYDLFVSNSLRGSDIEKSAIRRLNKTFSDLLFEETDGYLDEELRVDILIKQRQDNEVIGGIQVKPETYKSARKEVISFNEIRNNRWDKPVFYLYYSSDDKFTNGSELKMLIESIK